jgi:hypothetical protein
MDKSKKGGAVRGGKIGGGGGRRGAAVAGGAGAPTAPPPKNGSKPRREEEEEEEEGEDSGDLTEDDEEEDGDGSFGEEEEDDDDEDEDDEDDKDNIDVEFSFTDPRPIDFKSVRRLLERYCPGEEGFPVSSLAEDVIAQRVVGTMVKMPGDDLDDAYAFATLLPMVQHAHKDWARALKAYLLRKASKDEAALAALTAAWDSPATLGLLLNERIVNMPPELAPSMHDSLLQDMAWARANAPGDFRVALQDVTQVIVVSSCWLEAAAAGSGGEGDGGGAAALGGAVPPGFVAHRLRFEEALWAREATASFAFPVAAPDGLPGPAEEAAAPAGASSSSSSSSSGAGGGAGAERKGRKRKAGQEEEKEKEKGADSHFAPQLRQVLLLPVAALPRAAAAAAKQVEEAKEQRKREAEQAQPKAGASGGAAKKIKK